MRHISKCARSRNTIHQIHKQELIRLKRHLTYNVAKNKMTLPELFAHVAVGQTHRPKP